MHTFLLVCIVPLQDPCMVCTTFCKTIQLIYLYDRTQIIVSYSIRNLLSPHPFHLCPSSLHSNVCLLLLTFPFSPPSPFLSHLPPISSRLFYLSSQAVVISTKRELSPCLWKWKNSGASSAPPMHRSPKVHLVCWHTRQQVYKKLQ